MGCEYKERRIGLLGKCVALPVRDDGSGERLDTFPVDMRILKIFRIAPDNISGIDVLPGEEGVLSIFMNEGSDVVYKVPVCKKEIPDLGTVAMLDKSRLGLRDQTSGEVNPFALFVASLFGSGLGKSM